MLDSRLIRAEPARGRAGLARRGAPADALDRAVELDAHWAARALVAEALRLRRRRTAEEIARAKTAGEPTADLERAGREIADELRGARRDLARLEAERRQALLLLPNLPAPEVPEETTVLEEPASLPERGGMTHWDLIRMLDLAQTAAGLQGEPRPGGRGDAQRPRRVNRHAFRSARGPRAGA